MRMDIRQIKQIVEICEQGSFGRAARELGISQPALSRSVARLEDQLGVKLFERGGDGAKPTIFANYVVSRANTALLSIASLAQEVRLMSKGETGRLTVGIGPVLRELLVFDICTHMVAAFPKLGMRIRGGVAPEFMRQLMARSIDIAISSREEVDENEDPFLSGQIIRTDLFSDTLGIFVRPGHPILEASYSQALTYDRLLDYPMVGAGMTRSQMRLFPEKMTREQRHNIGAYQARDYGLIRHFLSISNAIGYAPTLAFTHDIKMEQLVRLEMPNNVKHHCVALIMPESWHSPVIRKFVSIAQEISQTLTAAAQPHANQQK